MYRMVHSSALLRDTHLVLNQPSTHLCITSFKAYLLFMCLLETELNM
jgi:hypothetical protein